MTAAAVESEKAMSVARVLRSKDGRTVVNSDLPDSEVVRILQTLDNSFAKTLVQKYAIYGGFTQNQLVWAHKLALEAKNPTPSAAPVELGDFAKLAQMFSSASSKLKYPKVVFDFEDQPITLYRAGERSRYAGQIQVTDGGKFRNGRYFGRIDSDGRFYPSRQCTDDVTAFLKLFAADPAGLAASYGKQSGRCCFCNIKLTDPRSVAVGFGPVCSKHYGLENEWKHAAKEDKSAGK